MFPNAFRWCCACLLASLVACEPQACEDARAVEEDIRQNAESDGISSEGICESGAQGGISSARAAEYENACKKLEQLRAECGD